MEGKAQFLLMTVAPHCPNCYIKIDSHTEPCRVNLVNPVSSGTGALRYVKPGEAGVDDTRAKSGPKYKSCWRENLVCDGYSGYSVLFATTVKHSWLSENKHSLNSPARASLCVHHQVTLCTLCFYLCVVFCSFFLNSLV